MQDKIEEMGERIVDEFFKAIPTLKPTAEHLQLAARAAESIAAATLLSIGADEARVKELGEQRDMALATLGNLGVAVTINARDTMRDAALRAFMILIKTGIGLAV